MGKTICCSFYLLQYLEWPLGKIGAPYPILKIHPCSHEAFLCLIRLTDHCGSWSWFEKAWCEAVRLHAFYWNIEISGWINNDQLQRRQLYTALPSVSHVFLMFPTSLPSCTLSVPTAAPTPPTSPSHTHFSRNPFERKKPDLMETRWFQ